MHVSRWTQSGKYWIDACFHHSLKLQYLNMLTRLSVLRLIPVLHLRCMSSESSYEHEPAGAHNLKGGPKC